MTLNKSYISGLCVSVLLVFSKISLLELLTRIHNICDNIKFGFDSMTLSPLTDYSVCMCVCVRVRVRMRVCVIQFNITFNIISVISWWCLFVADIVLQHVNAVLQVL